MPFAVTHILTAIILIDLFRIYGLKKKRFPLWLVLVGGISGLLPDIDIAIAWFLEIVFNISINIHQIYTHSLIIPAALLIIALLCKHVIAKKQETLFHILLVVAAGWTTHVLLDGIFATAPLFFPFTNERFGLRLVETLFSNIQGTLYMGLDAILLIFWLIYEWYNKKIKDYI
jgi:membrane-bound metal-dependent hydrolase YbcI (DUF457 family)